MAKTSSDPQKAAVKGVNEREAAKQSAVDEYYARAESAQPTPTQEENDLRKVGAAVDLEDDGSEPEGDSVRRIMESRIPGNNPYETRDVSSSGDKKSSK